MKIIKLFFFKVKARCSFERWLLIKAEKDLKKKGIKKRLLSRYHEWLNRGINSREYVVDLCRIIDEIYSQKQTLFAAEVETLSYKNFLFKWYYALYCTAFKMPREC